MHPCMFYVSSILFQHYMHVHLHGASFLEVFDGLVASSSPVRGSGTLQCGIRARLQHGPEWAMKMQWKSLQVAAWASMGHEEPVSKGMLPSAQKKSEENQ